MARSQGRSPVLLIAAFLVLFGVYQAAEFVGTVYRPGWWLGPVLMVCALLVGWPVGRWLGYRGYDAYGLDLAPRSAAVLLVGMALAFAVKALALLVGEQTGAYAISGPGFRGDGLAALKIVGLGALTTFIPSLAEDILTRGFFLKTLNLRWTGWAFVLVTAAVYTANHVWRLDWGWTEQARLFCLGLAYGAAAWRWRTLWGAVALHWGWNLANALADGFLTVEALDTQQVRFITAAAHLLMLAMVALWPAGAPAAARRR